MNRLQKMQLRQSEARLALGALLDTTEGDRADTYSEADLAKATTEVRSLEGEIQAAMVAGEDETAETVKTGSSEGREMRELVNRSNVGEIFDAALGKRPVDGASAEIQKHYGLDVNQVPLAMLAKSRPGDDDMETRAVTPAPTNVGPGATDHCSLHFRGERCCFLGSADADRPE